MVNINKAVDKAEEFAGILPIEARIILLLVLMEKYSMVDATYLSEWTRTLYSVSRDHNAAFDWDAYAKDNDIDMEEIKTEYEQESV